jgi:hypothetical protein
MTNSTSSRLVRAETRHPPVFELDFRRAVHGLRGALNQLLKASGADSEHPQAIARGFSLDKSLAWKLSRIVRTDDAALALRHIPGKAGWRIVMERFGANGAPPEALEGLRTALAEFERMKTLHAGDRATLELVARGLSDQKASASESEQARKLAFLGNCGTWGVQARLQFSATIAFPNAEDPARADVAGLGGLVDFQRLHSDVRWLLFRSAYFDDEGSVASEGTPLDPSVGEGEPPLIHRFCSQPLPELNLIHGGTSLHYVLPPGPVGKTAALDCIRGALDRSLGPIYCAKPEDTVGLGCNVETPMEHLIADVMIRSDLPWHGLPELRVAGQIEGSTPLAVAEQVRYLGRGLVPPATPEYETYTELMTWAFERLGQDPDEFDTYRFTMAYPPMPSEVQLHFPLPPRP